MKIKNFDKIIILRPKKSYFNDGSRFEGQSNKVEDSKLPNGYGKLYYPNGHIQYKGNFKNGLFNGYGEYISPNHYEYLGDFKNNKKHGNGKIIWKDDKASFKGIFKNDKVIKGEYVLSNGNKFTGLIKNNKFYIGKYIDKEIQRSFDGVFINNDYLKGTITFPNGDRFKGTFRKNEPYKSGKWTLANGNTYTGEFKHVKKTDNEITFLWHGEGLYETKQFYYRGSFKNKMFHGWGVLRHKTKESFVGKFKNNEMYDGVYKDSKNGMHVIEKFKVKSGYLINKN
ncbi:hypothetical protein OAY25_03710 [Candidatus Pelagibacter sp.]|nr:hypothetical protein [Candidatus Pelagibacter sp.]